jgi:predicted transcriptional regulator
MNAISIVVSYKLFGLSNDDIAQMLGITDEQVMNILSSDSFKIYYDSVLNNIMENDSENIQMEFKRLSKKMLKNIEDLADNSNVDVVKLNAAQDILDRAGYSADKLNEKQLSNESNTLNICFIKKGN